jgi:hypothetical protein
VNYLQDIMTDAVAVTNTFMKFLSMWAMRRGLVIKRVLIGLVAGVSIFAAFASLAVLAIGFGDFSGWFAVVILGAALCAIYFLSLQRTP